MGMTVMVAYLAAPRPILSQSQHNDQIEGSILPVEGSRLPAMTGQPLTLTPLDMRGIDCVVAQWQPTTTRPVLTLICPPPLVFAPLHVLVKLAWMKTEDVPVNPERILAPVGTPTKIRTNKAAAEVMLQVGEKGEHKPRSTWIGFNAVMDVALLGGRLK